MCQSLPPGYIELAEWNIVIIEINNDIYEKFLGYDVNADEFRISSKIVTYDKISAKGETISGAIYKLQGLPGKLHPTAQVIFNKLTAHPEVKVALKF